jgi:hypothetical protein
MAKTISQNNLRFARVILSLEKPVVVSVLLEVFHEGLGTDLEVLHVNNDRLKTDIYIPIYT